MSGNLTDNPNAAWVVNGVNAVLQTDLVEGQAAGASHGGIGNSNIAQQVLANRTAYLYNQQQTDKSNISTLQGQVSTLFGLVGEHGIAAYSGGNWSWTVPANIVRARFILVGGGGGGSNCQAANIDGFVSGGGGGAGAMVVVSVAVSPGQVYSGAVGSGGSPTGTGGTTTLYVGSTLIATSGGGGGAYFPGAQTAPGASGGTGSVTGGYDGYAFSGGMGSDGQSASYLFAGNGAPGPWGGGGRAGNGGGYGAPGYGAGGGGAYDVQFTGILKYGGSGGSGLMLIIF